MIVIRIVFSLSLGAMARILLLGGTLLRVRRPGVQSTSYGTHLHRPCVLYFKKTLVLLIKPLHPLNMSASQEPEDRVSFPPLDMVVKCLNAS